MIFIQLALSFIIGGLFIAGSLYLAETYGSTIAGVIAGMPSTSAISLVFIGLVSGTKISAEAAAISPVALSLAGQCLLVFAYLSRRYQASTSILLTIGYWFLGSSTIFWLSPLTPLTCSVSFLLMLPVLILTLRILNLPKPQKVSHSRSTVAQLLLRGTIAGTIISSAVLAAKVGGALFGAIVGNFPAAYVATLLLASRTAGKEFARSLVPSLLLSGQITIGLYLHAVAALYPKIDLLWGTLLSYILSIISAYCLYRRLSLRKKAKIA